MKILKTLIIFGSLTLGLNGEAQAATASSNSFDYGDQNLAQIMKGRIESVRSSDLSEIAYKAYDQRDAYDKFEGITQAMAYYAANPYAVGNKKRAEIYENVFFNLLGDTTPHWIETQGPQNLKHVFFIASVVKYVRSNEARMEGWVLLAEQLVPALSSVLSDQGKWPISPPEAPTTSVLPTLAELESYDQDLLLVWYEEVGLNDNNIRVICEAAQKLYNSGDSTCHNLKTLQEICTPNAAGIMPTEEVVKLYLQLENMWH